MKASLPELKNVGGAGLRESGRGAQLSSKTGQYVQVYFDLRYLRKEVWATVVNMRKQGGTSKWLKVKRRIFISG